MLTGLQEQRQAKWKPVVYQTDALPSGSDTEKFGFTSCFVCWDSPYLTARLPQELDSNIKNLTETMILKHNLFKIMITEILWTLRQEIRESTIHSIYITTACYDSREISQQIINQSAT